MVLTAKRAKQTILMFEIFCQFLITTKSLLMLWKY